MGCLAQPAPPPSSLVLADTAIFHVTAIYIPLISRVRGLNGKLWTEFFSFLLWPKRKARRPSKQGRKKRGSITCRTDRADEAHKMFIIWLFIIPGKERIGVLRELEVLTTTYRPEVDQSQSAKSVSI